MFDLGVQMVRYTYHDRTTGNQPDSNQLGFFSNRAKDFFDKGIKSLLILTYDSYPSPHPNASDNDWNQHITNFARRAGQLAEALKPYQTAFQIWNEPDHHMADGYRPTLREAVFGRMLRASYDAIKAADANATVVAGGLATGNAGWLTKVIQSQNGTLPADVVAIHPYGQRPDPNWPHSHWGPGGAGSYVGNLINSYYQAGLRKPMWITEIGIKAHEVDVPNDNRSQEEKAAEYLQRFYRAIDQRYSDKVKQVLWFCYSDGMVVPFGLKDANLNPKPIYHTYKQMAVAARPKKPVVPPPPPPPPPPGPGPGTGTGVTTNAEVAKLVSQLQTLQGQTAQIEQQLQQLFARHTQLTGELNTLLPQITQLHRQLVQLQTEQAQLHTDLQNLQTSLPGGVAKPAMQDIVESLPRRFDVPQYATRSESQIRRITIIHTANNFDARTIANFRVNNNKIRGVQYPRWPGIGYHFFITSDGTIQQTNRLTTISYHVSDKNNNYDSDSVGVCLQGNFMTEAPTQAQMEALTQLVTWLVSSLGLTAEAIYGHKDLIN
ncbi:MAG: N-acetylmuramoyl-L-alanine amidase, partial [Anaerolineae bacterium]|nr:N-acetylmuramoyl-L-alanine amidase [Anaerolineae bacterium]